MQRTIPNASSPATERSTSPARSLAIGPLGTAGRIAVWFLLLTLSPALAGGSDRDATRWVDRDFGFRVERADSEHWHFRGPRRESDPLRLQIEHHIGGKKDLIRVQVWAWDLKSVQGGESLHLDKWKQQIRDQLSEVAEEKHDDRDRYGRYRTVSYSAYGRLSKDETQIRRLKAHVFKTRRHLYTIFVVHEPEMDEKYEKELRLLQKSFKAS